MAQQEQVEQLHEICRDCTAVSVDDLIANENWGTITFEKSRPQLELAFSLCNDLLRFPVNILPENRINTIINCAKDLQAVIAAIKKFDIEEGYPRQHRNQISSHIASVTEKFFAEVLQWTVYLAYLHGNWEADANKLSDSVKRSEKKLEELKDYCEKRKSEVEKIVTTARESSAEVGVAHFTQDFQTEAESLQASSYKWLVATSGLAIATLAAAYYLFDAPSTNETMDWAYVIHQTTTRLILLGTLITATIWCGKMYRALKHQVTTNKHRANALKTFQAFVQATDDVSVKDAVLLETTRAIFDLRPSGYLDRESSGAKTEQTRIVEIPNRTLNAEKYTDE